MAIGNQIGLQNSEGFIIMNAIASPVSFAFTTSFQELTSLGTNFVLASLSQNFEMTTDGRLKYTGVKEKPFVVSASMSLTTSTSYGIQIYKNGVALPGIAWYVTFGYTNIFKAPTMLATNDYISLYTRRLSGGSLSIAQVTVSAESLSGS